MLRSYLPLIVANILLLTSCSTPKTSFTPSDSPSTAQLISNTKIIDTFTTDELFAEGGGGCGMSLWKANNNMPMSFLLFNGLEPNSMMMKIRGKMTKFERTEAEGFDFHGQKTFQTFTNQEQKITVKVAVIRGEKGETESVAIASGVILIVTEKDLQEMAVKGDAGC